MIGSQAVAAQALLARFQQERAIAVIRSANCETGLQMAQAVYGGGLRLLEVTWSSAAPGLLLRAVKQALPDCLVGAGTVTQIAHLAEAQAAGADFVFSPGTDVNLIRAAIARQIPIIPGALTPSEILQAWRLGATSVKVFPIAAVGYEHYVHSLQVPLAGIPLIPTGGVTLDNAASMIQAGAVAVGIAGELFPPAAIAAEKWEIVQARAALLCANLAAYRC